MNKTSSTVLRHLQNFTSDDKAKVRGCSLYTAKEKREGHPENNTIIKFYNLICTFGPKVTNSINIITNNVLIDHVITLNWHKLSQIEY